MTSSQAKKYMIRKGFSEKKFESPKFLFEPMPKRRLTNKSPRLKKRSTP